MDKQGKPVSEKVEEFMGSFREIEFGEKSEGKYKISPDEYFSGESFKQRIKQESLKQQQIMEERRAAFREAQAKNPIKGRPRKKRGRKVR